MRPGSSVLPVAWVTLRVLILANWIFGALVLALLAASFEAEEWTWRALGVGSVAGHEGLIAGMRAIMVIGIGSVPLAYLALTRLVAIVETVRSGDPFIPANARRLRAIAWTLVGLELLHLFVVAIASAVSTAETPLDIGPEFSINKRSSRAKESRRAVALGMRSPS